jgi:membrane-bound lytic murein transglycosylase A
MEGLFVMLRNFIIFALVFTFTACITQNEALKKIKPSNYPVFTDDLNLVGLRAVLQKQIDYFEKLDRSKLIKPVHEDFTIDSRLESLKHLLKYVKSNPTPESLDRFITENFDIYISAGTDGGRESLFTGYYAPVLNGSRKKTKRYKYPLYRRPPEMIKVKAGKFRKNLKGVDLRGRMKDGELLPYYSRTEIDIKGVLKKRRKKLIFAWVDDYVDLFFLHIQGSGQIRLPNGEYVNVNYEDKNGHPYTSLGKLLIIDEKIEREDMSLQAIKKYFRKHPDDIKHYLFQNESYVFFRELPKKEFPLGCLNVPLTSGRSVAADELVFPKGGLVYVQTEKPVLDANDNIVEWEKFGRLLVDQDKGGAIRGAGRMDIYFGNTKYAEIAAGNFKQEGKIYYLVKKKYK